ncbi:hypothetical protein GOD80_25880 [Sinorhizobium medicae]|nr:hypothetical protein [Sinorhizobium medicae]MDX0590156.1 hypothetical protein [Sinorhizobium medicae]MDX0808592.1 hypothetical protein [Sinorhizobium medicae]
MSALERLDREVGDLRKMAIGIERSLRKGRRDDGDEQPDLAGPFVAMAASAIMKALNRPERAEEWQRKAVTNPAMTTIPGWASELVNSVTAGFILSLSSGIRAAPALFARAHGFHLSGPTRGVSVEADAVAAFTAEADGIGVSQANFGSNSVLPCSVKALTTFSEELADFSTPTVETVLRQILSEAIGQCIENRFFSSEPQIASAPAGILAGKTPIAPGTSFAEDAQALVSALSPAADPVFVVSPGRRVGLAASVDLNAFGYPVLASSALDDTTMVCVDADKLMVGMGGQPKFAIGREAALVEDTAPPTDLLTGSPVRSLWQTNAMSLKATLPISWSGPSAAAFIENLAW